MSEMPVRPVRPVRPELPATPVTPVIIPIHDLQADALIPYTSLNEPRLKHYCEPEPGLFLAETLQVAERALQAGYEPVSFLSEDRFADAVTQLLSSCPGPAPAAEPIPLYTAPLELLIGITGYNLTRGVLGLFRRRTLPSVEAICGSASRLAVLESVGNPTNVGAIFRSAAAMGMDGILLSYDCCDPLYRRSLRVSMGTVFQIPWTIMPRGFTRVHRYIDEEKGIYRKEDASYDLFWPDHGMELLRGQGFYTVSMALTDTAVPIDDPILSGRGRMAVILGNEGSGLLPRTLDLSDATAIIPMHGGVDSLNVAAAGAVIFWQLRSTRSPRASR